MSEFHPKGENEPRSRRSRLARAGAAAAGLGLAGALWGCGGISTDQAKAIAKGSAIGQGLVAAGYTLVDVNGSALVKRASSVGFPTEAIKSDITFVGYRKCGNVAASVCVTKPLGPGEVEPVVLELHPIVNGNYSKDVVAICGGAEFPHLSVGIASADAGAKLTADQCVQRMQSDVTNAPTFYSTPHAAPNGDRIVQG